MLLIKKTEIFFSSGLNVFTGETGSGKSIIFDCLDFVMGNKTRRSLLKENEKRGEVTVEFGIDGMSDVVDFISELSIPVLETLIVRRVEFSDGRKKSYINDINCTTEILKSLGEKIIEFVDQKNNSKILRKQNHINLLDDFCSNKKKINELKQIWSKLNGQKEKLSNLIKLKNKSLEELEFKKKSLLELKKLNLMPGEFEELETKRKTLKSSYKIIEYLKESYDLITQNETNKNITTSIIKLEKISELLSKNKLLNESIDGLNLIINNLDEAEKNIQELLKNFSSSDMSLEDIEDRLFEIKRLSRKHNVFADELISLKTELEKDLHEFDNFDEEIKSINVDLLENENKYDKIANLISNIRKEKSKQLSKIVNHELSHLKMDGIKFLINCNEKKEKTIIGKDEIVFLTRNNNLAVQDLEKIVSGGELSRILLAIKVSLAKETEGLTLIFDEIDRGIGGATAESVGERLSILSKTEQILLITHSPQVAAKANKHWKVSKKITEDGFPISFTRELDEDNKKKELARMISGKVVTKEAIAAAEKLMP